MGRFNIVAKILKEQIKSCENGLAALKGKQAEYYGKLEEATKLVAEREKEIREHKQALEDLVNISKELERAK